LRAPALVPAPANGAFAPKIQAFFVGSPRDRGTASRSLVWDFCNARALFRPGHSLGPFFCSDVAKLQQNRGGPQMSIDTLLLILLVAFGAGFVLNRLDFGRRTRRFG
jgi:hypothetical protein